MSKVRIFSSGMGVQSIAVLVLQAQGKITPYDFHLFANVGDKAEHPDTLIYFRDIASVYAKKHSIPLLELKKTNAKGEVIDLYDHAISTDNKSLDIPFVMPQKGYAKRNCTNDWKVMVVDKWIKSQHYTHATVGLGFSADEAHRASKKPDFSHDTILTRLPAGGWKKGKKLGFSRMFHFPLLSLNLNRASCEQIILDAGLPLPPKSACWFCPFTSRSKWIEMKKHNPQMMTKNIDFEKALNEKYQRLINGRKNVSPQIFLHRDAIPLTSIPTQLGLWDIWADTELDSCDTGYCGL